jgi:hypothetical protein
MAVDMGVEGPFPFPGNLLSALHHHTAFYVGEDLDECSYIQPYTFQADRTVRSRHVGSFMRAIMRKRVRWLRRPTQTATFPIHLQ